MCIAIAVAARMSPFVVIAIIRRTSRVVYANILWTATPARVIAAEMSFESASSVRRLGSC
jgi:hypothetical protein